MPPNPGYHVSMPTRRSRRQFLSAACATFTAGVMWPSALRAGDDPKPFGVRLLVQRQHRSDAGAIHGDRLLREDVLPGVHGGRQMRRAEARRCREDHVVDVAREDLFVCVEAGERSIRGHRDLVAELLT